MKKLKYAYYIIPAVVLIIVILWCAGKGFTRDRNSKLYAPEGVYIEMTKDFYEALKEESQTETKIYSNDPSIEYLKQISISSRFTVETNLQIIKQQERIIQLLQSLLEKKNR